MSDESRLQQHFKRATTLREQFKNKSIALGGTFDAEIDTVLSGYLDALAFALGHETELIAELEKVFDTTYIEDEGDNRFYTPTQLGNT